MTEYCQSEQLAGTCYTSTRGDGIYVICTEAAQVDVTGHNGRTKTSNQVRTDVSLFYSDTQSIGVRCNDEYNVHSSRVHHTRPIGIQSISITDEYKLVLLS